MSIVSGIINVPPSFPHGWACVYIPERTTSILIRLEVLQPSDRELDIELFIVTKEQAVDWVNWALTTDKRMVARPKLNPIKQYRTRKIEDKVELPISGQFALILDNTKSVLMAKTAVINIERA